VEKMIGARSLYCRELSFGLELREVKGNNMVIESQRRAKSFRTAVVQWCVVEKKKIDISLDKG